MSYLIVDEAEEDLEIARDPFLEAGIDIPENLPHHPMDHKGLDTVSMASVTSKSSLKIKEAMSNMTNLHKRVLTGFKGNGNASFDPSLSMTDIRKLDLESGRQRSSNSCSLARIDSLTCDDDHCNAEEEGRQQSAERFIPDEILLSPNTCETSQEKL